MRRIIAVGVGLMLLLGLLAGAPSTAEAKTKYRADVSLNSMGSRYVNTTIEIKGYLSSNSTKVTKTLRLQQYKSGHWVTVKKITKKKNGAFTFKVRAATKPTTTKYRVRTYIKGKRKDTSRTLQVRTIARPVVVVPPVKPPVKPPVVPTRPAPVIETRVNDALKCEILEVAVENQERVHDWVLRNNVWVAGPWTAWTTVGTTTRAASAADCVNIGNQPGDALLPDIRIRNLDKCGTGDMAATGGKCFKIDPSAPYNSDFPSLEGKKLLKFPVITLNVGDGPSELIADRSATSTDDWKAYQTFYRPNGDRVSVLSSNVDFYFAGDGHNHWHVKDFDEYDLTNADGDVVARAEKHGYCLQDNTTYPAMQGQPGVPESPVYLESTSCGKGLPNALTIIHGLSKGWGDTYPTSLPDQAIDITGLPDGVYTARIQADQVGAVVESDETNNTASMQIRIEGDTVTPIAGTATGGLS